MPTNHPRPATPNDQEMVDPMQASPAASPRQPLPTSLASFALSHVASTSAPSSPSTHSMSIDDSYPYVANMSSYPLYRKLRRSSLLSLRGIQRDRSGSGSGSGSGGGAETPPVHHQSGSFSSSGGSPMNTVFPSWKERAGSPLTGAYVTDEPQAEEAVDDDEETACPPKMVLDDPSGESLSQDSTVLPSTPPPRLEPAFIPSPSIPITRKGPVSQTNPLEGWHSGLTF